MNNYSFLQFKEDLDKGFQIYLTFVNNRYLIFKTSENCYTQQLLNYDEKNPQPRRSIITKKRLKEIYLSGTDFEYKSAFFLE